MNYLTGLTIKGGDKNSSTLGGRAHSLPGLNWNRILALDCKTYILKPVSLAAVYWEKCLKGLWVCVEPVVTVVI